MKTAIYLEDAYIESNYGLNYYIYFVLESGADFIQIKTNT